MADKANGVSIPYLHQVFDFLACSIVFGLLMTILLVLIIVPCLCAILADFDQNRIEKR